MIYNVGCMIPNPPCLPLSFLPFHFTNTMTSGFLTNSKAKVIKQQSKCGGSSFFWGVCV